MDLILANTKHSDIKVRFKKLSDWFKTTLSDNLSSPFYKFILNWSSVIML